MSMLKPLEVREDGELWAFGETSANAMKSIKRASIKIPSILNAHVHPLSSLTFMKPIEASQSQI